MLKFIHCAPVSEANRILSNGIRISRRYDRWNGVYLRSNER